MTKRNEQYWKNRATQRMWEYMQSAEETADEAAKLYQKAAAYLNQDPEQVFKTLVTKGAGGGYYVFDIPVAENLDLKKAAKAVGEKSIAMLPQKELLPLTGYVHGGCSPVGMKKQFPTVFHETVELFDTICVSAGKIGAQVEVAPADLIALLGAQTADVTVE